MSRIINNPTESINRADIHVPAGITLADPEFLKPPRIDMLLGVKIFWDILCIGQIKTTRTQPCWQKMHFGWIAAGRIVARTTMESTVCNLSTNDELNYVMKRFWEIEHCTRKNQISPDERKCEEYFESTVRRNSAG